MKNIDQALYDELFKRLSELHTVYDLRPMHTVPYPFIDFQDTSRQLQANKTNVLGDITLTLNVWTEATKRSQCTQMVQDVLDVASEIEEAYGHYVVFSPSQSDVAYMNDTSTNTPLKRALVELKFRIR